MARATAADWAARYVLGRTPWNLRRPHPELVRRIPELGIPGTAIVPGAGLGHDAGALAEAGWQVTALEFVADLEEALRTRLGGRGTAVIADAFDYRPDEAVDLIFDHTFFCAIPPEDRTRFGEWAADVVRPGGVLASVVFPVGRPLDASSPPFPMSTDDLFAVLDPAFELVVDTPAENTECRSWRSRWAVFQRL